MWEGPMALAPISSRLRQQIPTLFLLTEAGMLVPWSHRRPWYHRTGYWEAATLKFACPSRDPSVATFRVAQAQAQDPSIAVNITAKEHKEICELRSLSVMYMSFEFGLF